MINPFEKVGFKLIDDAYKDLDVYQKEDVVLVAMNKYKSDKKASREASNHLDGGLINELTSVFVELGSKEGFASVILASAHRVVFSRGAKIEMMHGATEDQCHFYIEEAQHLLLEIQRFKTPVIAAINGITFGGALEVVMGCDYRICSDRGNVAFGLPEASLGIIPGMGGTQNLTRLIGKEKALDVMLNARMDILAEEAKADGLVDMIVPYETLFEDVFAFAKRDDLKKTFTGADGISTVKVSDVRKEVENSLKNLRVEVNPDDRGAPLSKAIIQFISVNTSPENYLDALKYEQGAVCYIQGTADCQEGLTALIEERKPEFLGK